MRPLYLTILSLFTAGFMTSCDHKDLIYDDTETPEVKIVFDWENAQDADPQSVVAYLFPITDNSPALRYNFSEKEGGRANVPAGEYIGLGMNSDNTGWARFRNIDDHELFEVYTDDLATLSALGLQTRSIPRARDAESERMTLPAADMMWTDRQDNLSVDPYRLNQTLTFYPEEITCHYSVTINDVENIDYLKGANLDATLSGLSESYQIGQRSTSSTPATMPVVLHRVDGRNSVFGSFINFGASTDLTRKQILTVYLVFEDHTGSYATFDVSDQIREAPDPHHVDIVVSGLNLPHPIASGSGFVPNVNEWESVNYDLDM